MLANDGRTLTFRFIGTPAQYADYPDADGVRDGHGGAREAGGGRPRRGRHRLDYAEEREVVVRLAAPLGNRVLVGIGHGPGTTTFGPPITVLTAA